MVSQKHKVTLKLPEQEEEVESLYGWDELLTYEQAWQKIQVSQTKFRELLSQGLPVIDLGNSTKRILLSSLLAYMKNRERPSWGN